MFLQAGYTKESIAQVVDALPEGNNQEDEEETVSYIKKRAELKRKRNSGKLAYKSKEWIINKKERQRRQGRDVRPDNKFTGRKRSGKGF